MGISARRHGVAPRAGLSGLAGLKGLAGLAGLVWVSAACAPTASAPPGEASRRQVTAYVADAVVRPLLDDAAERAAALRAATADNDLPRAQQAWRDVMAAWQGLEMVHVGPAGSPTAFEGGQGLRDGIYAWPQVNLCAVDAQLAQDAFEATGWVESRLPNVIGLAALEYVLFAPADMNMCPPTAEMNADGTWSTLGADTVASRRMRYAAVVASDVERRIQALRTAWAYESDDGFAAALRQAGAPGAAFPTAQRALDELFAALFAVEVVTKDKRLGVPAGLHAPVGGEACAGGCVERAESRFAGVSKDNVRANLVAVRAVLTGQGLDGVEGTGFDVLLRERGAADVADAMGAHLEGALAAVEGFSGTFEEALATEPTRVVAVYDAVKRFTDDLKSTFPSALGLRVPDEGAGDND